MKRTITLLLSLVFASTSSAGFLGWISSSSCDWSFIQDTGGIRIGAPVLQDGMRQLPVHYDISGLTEITRQPSKMNSGRTVRKVDVKRKGACLVIRVISQAAEAGKTAGPLHLADIAHIPPGNYVVYYDTANDPQKYLGQVQVP